MSEKRVALQEQSKAEQSRERRPPPLHQLVLNYIS